ncbi:hypothetical protein TNCV_1636371 [Trichonephila clavipes]|uniref:Uncharacterized protein n=1 Tax=Trichonephila clavipes TaxID=2585209 RepID=A0A8X6RHL6_TRICX|nr:hypothetical protein TNCV_1636371 [Trichonephila clavipes]
MGTPTAINVAPAGSEYAETVRSNHCKINKSQFRLLIFKLANAISTNGKAQNRGKKYETKHMVANSTPMTHVKSRLPIWRVTLKELR